MEKTIDDIKKEARQLFPDNGITGNPLIYGKRIGYEKAAIQYEAHISKIRKGLEWVLANIDNDPIVLRQEIASTIFALSSSTINK